MQDVICSGTLSAASIDEMSAAIVRTLEELDVDPKETARIRLSAESVMGIWAEELGEAVLCRLIKKQRFGKPVVLLQADGKSVDPTRYEDELLLSVSGNANIAEALGMPAEYRYISGRNVLKLRLPEKKMSPIRHVLIALAAALVVGLGLRWLAPDAAAQIAEKLITPLMNTITKALSLIAGPLVFLAIISGITGVGDSASFGKIGKTLTVRILVMTFVVAVFVWLCICWMFPVTLSGGTEGEAAFSRILEMILDTVPGDMVTPFQTGNAMQIIFIAGCIGLGSIMLGDTVLDAVNVANQINAIVQMLMAGISKLLPTYIFLSISNLIITSDPAELSQILLPVLLSTALSLVVALLHSIYTSVKVGLPLCELLKCQLQTFLVAFSTASSAATFGTNVECCENRLHIDTKLVRFGVPFGQVLFKPGFVTTFVILTPYMAKQYNVPITPVWIVTMLIVASILAIAAPAIPGGMLTCALVLFTQLNIPEACLALSATVLTFSDYACTACSLVCLQQSLLICAKKLGLLKHEWKKTEP